MHPAGAVADAGGAVMNVRAAVRVNMVFGLAMAAMAIVAATINPGDTYATKQCAATEADALRLRGAALLLVLTGVAQAVAAAAADVAVAGSLRALGRWLAASASLLGGVNASALCYVVQGAAVVAVGRCAGEYFADIVNCYVLVGVSGAVLFAVSLAVTFSG